MAACDEPKILNRIFGSRLLQAGDFAHKTGDLAEEGSESFWSRRKLLRDRPGRPERSDKRLWEGTSI